MTRAEFIALCGEFTVDPGIALECVEVRLALQVGKAEDVRKALEENV